MATACPQGYVETLALGELEEELEDSGVCLVLGLPGHGKTALALQAMQRLKDSQHFKPVWLRQPEQWDLLPGENEEYRGVGTGPLEELQAGDARLSEATDNNLEPSGNAAQPQSHGPSQKKEGQDSRRYVVLLDDVFGKGHYDAAKKKAWEEVFDLVLAKVKAKQVKVILVSRAHIYEECKKSLGGHQLFDDVKTVDLRESEYWTRSDRTAILSNFLHEKDVRIDRPIWDFVWASESCTQIGFPQVCRFFASDKQAQLRGEDFFREPLQFLYNQFEQMQENDIRSYLVLILTWLEGGILSSDYLEFDNTDSKRRISDLCEQFEVKDVMTIRQVQKKARSLCGVYLSEDEEGSFRFTHQSICDSLVVAMCRFDLKRALHVCSIQQVCEYVRTKNSAVDESGLTYTVPKSKWPLLAARLVKAMTSEELIPALDHPSLRDGEFVSVIVDKYLTASHISQIMQREHKLRKGRLLSPEKWLPCLMEITLFRDEEILTSIAFFLILKESALTKHFLRAEILSSLPEAEVSQHLREALQAACYVSNEALVTELLERRAEVTPDTVRAACASDKDDVVTVRKVIERLPREQLDVSLYRDLLGICCVTSKVECLKFLLTDARFEERQGPLDRVFSELVRVSHPSYPCRSHFMERLPEVLSTLKNAGARLDKARLDLRFAAGHPSAFALKEHLAGDTSQLFAVFPDGSTPLHEAAQYGSVECLRVLMESPATKHLNVNALNDANETPLCLAVAGNHIDTMDLLLKHGADPNVGSVTDDHSFSRSPLLAAAARHHYSAMKLLLQHNASPDVTDERKRTPLHVYAASRLGFFVDVTNQERQHCEELLVANTSNINQKDTGGSVPLHLACETGQASLVQKLLSRKAKVDVVDNEGMTALHTLACCGPYKKCTEDADEIVKMLVESYCSQNAEPSEETTGICNVSVQDWINSGDKGGRTPLHLAAERDNLTVVKALLKHKASTEIQDSQDWTALHAATHMAVIDELIAHGAKVDVEDSQKRLPLHVFAEQMCNTTHRRFGKHLSPKLKVVLNKQDARGRTALHTAGARGVHSLVRSLLKAGARADLKDSDGRLPLHCLAAGTNQSLHTWEENYEKLRAKSEEKLVSATPDVNVRDRYGMTPLHLAAHHCSFSLISILLDKDAKADTKDDHDRLPVHCMAARQWAGFCAGEGASSKNKILRTEVETKLLSATPDVNVQDKYDKTPLHLAAEHSNFSFISVLLNKGARADTKDKDHCLPLHYMAQQQTGLTDDRELNTLVQKKLVNATPDVNVLDKNDKTPLHMAAERANLSLISALLDKNARTDPKDRFDCLPLHYMAAWRTDCREDKDLRALVEEKLVRATPDVNVQDSNGKTPVHLAAEHGNFSLIITLLDKDARIDIKDNSDRLPFQCMESQWTRSQEDKEMRALVAKKLASAIRDVNVQDKNRKTPLHLAAEQGNFFLISIFLEKDARTDAKDNDDRLPLHYMAARKPHDIEDKDRQTLVEEKLVSATPDVNVQDKYGMTPLHVAAERGSLSMITALLDKGAKMDTKTYSGRLPLHCMADRRPQYREDKDIKALVEEKLSSAISDVNAQDEYGKTPLHLAAEHDNFSMIATLLAKGARMDTKDKEGRVPFHYMAAQTSRSPEDKEMRTLAVKKFASALRDVNVQDKLGKTPLHLAAEHGNFSLITILLDKDAKTDTKDNVDRLPLHYMAAWQTYFWKEEMACSKEDNLKILVEEKLVRSTSDVNVQDKNGWTPLHLAAERGKFCLVTALLDKSARTDTKDEHHRLPLHYMAAHYSPILMTDGLRTLAEKKLVNATADVNLQDKCIKTPLHLAAENDNFCLITTLLDKGARTDIMDEKHRLPLHCLAAGKIRHFEKSNLRTVAEKKLVSATPDVNVKDKDGKTPLRLAAEHGNIPLVDTLLAKGARTDI